MRYAFDETEFTEFIHTATEEECEDDYDVADEQSDAGKIDTAAVPFSDPVPVRILQDDATFVIQRAAMSWQGQKILVLGVNVPGYQQPQLIVGSNPRRRYVQISNLGNKNIALGPTSSVKFGTAANGLLGNFELIPNGFGGGIVMIPTTAEIWALADPTSATGEAINVLEVIDAGQF